MSEILRISEIDPLRAELAEAKFNRIPGDQDCNCCPLKDEPACDDICASQATLIERIAEDRTDIARLRAEFEEAKEHCRESENEAKEFIAKLDRKDAEIAALEEIVVQLENGLHLAQPYILPESRYWKQGIARSIAIQLQSARARLAEIKGEA